LPEFQRDALEAVCRKHGIDLVVGFGSAFAGCGDAQSDVDIAVRVTPGRKIPRQLDLVADLAKVFGDRVDVAVLNGLGSETLRREIFRDGKPLYQAHPDLFCEEASLAIRRYADTAWLRERSRQAIKRALENG
jgi:predicted nucleotidyltransferase